MIKKKALEPLISSILLIVISVILVTVILSWGQNFSNQSVSQTSSLINHDILSDKQPFIRFVEARNGMYVFDYYPPNQSDINFTVIGYSLLGYNDYISLEPEYIVDRPGKHYIPLGIINEDIFTIGLLLDNGSNLIFKNVTPKNQSPQPSDCPAGFVPVPGNHLYGTVGSKGGFCVAKYEMKMDANGDGLGDLVADYPTCKYTTDYNVWYYLNSGCSTGTIVSTPQGSPITGISQAQAKVACQAIGGHLITNEEWMTLARNIEIVSSNWSGGTIGSGYLPRGNSSSSSAKDGFDELSGTTKRTLILSNGEIVWDLAGNVYDWVDKNINVSVAGNLSHYDDGLGNKYPIGSFNWIEYSTGVSGYLDKYLTNKGLFEHKDLYLLNSNYNTTHGIGRMYTQADYVHLTIPRAVARGGYWNGGASAGVLGMYLSYSPSSTSYYIGFRCAVVP